MGCCESKEEVGQPTKINLKDHISPSLRSQIIEVLRKNDIFLIMRVFNEKQADPGWSLYPENPGWNSFHECCYRDSLDVLEFLVEFARSQKLDALRTQLNQKEKDGLTPAMVCCKNDASKTFEFLLKFNLVNLNDTNKEGSSVEMIAFNHSARCRELIKEAQAKPIRKQSNDAALISYLKARPSKTTEPLNNQEISQPFPGKFEKIKGMLSNANENFKIYGILAEMENETEVFVDDEFSADSNALALNQDLVVDAYGNIKWLRSHDLYQKRFSSMKLYDRVAPEDIDLNGVPDSSLGLALQVLSEFPMRIMQSILNKEINKHGVYSCKFFVMGLAAEVCSDDLYPCDQTGELMFIRTKNGELWPTVMEKLGAKFYGCYKNTQSGLLDDLFEDILGVPCTNYQISKYKPESIYELLTNFVKLNFVAAASSLGDKPALEGNNRIQDGHYIINAFESGGTRYIKLRVPSGIFKGKPLTAPIDEKDPFSQALPEENAVLIKADDIEKFFDVISVAFYHDGWHKNYISMDSWRTRAEYISLRIIKPTKIYIVVNQESVKLSTEVDYEYSDVEILLAKQDGVSLSKISSGDKGEFFPGKTLHVDHKKMIRLEEGEYIIRVKIPWKTRDQYNFTVTTYSEEEVLLDYLPRENYFDFLHQLYLNEGRSSPDTYELGKDSYFANKWEGNHFWLYMRNDSSEKIWNLEIEFKKLVNIRPMKRYKLEDMSLKYSIPPNSEMLAILKRTPNEQATIEWNFQSDWVTI